MRARNLKPGTFKNELLGSSDPLHTILFEGLWCLSDREGRLEDRPLRICAELFPYRRNVTEKKTDTMLQWLHDHGFIARYSTGGVRFIQVIEFLKHQNPHKNEKPSTIPPLSSIQHGASTGQAPERSRNALNDSGLFSDSGILNPHSLNPDSGILTPDPRDASRGSAGSSAVPGELASATRRLAHRTRAPGKTETKRAEKPRDTLRNDAIKLAQSGMAAADIAKSLGQYDVTLDQVEAWIGHLAPLRTGAA